MSLDPNTKLVTRVVTCFRQWDFVSLWLTDDSLFQPHVRWMLVNDDPGSPPPDAVFAQLGARSIELRTPLFNRGMSGARNFGLHNVTTPWVEFVDGDDWPLPLSEAPLLEHAGKTLLIYRFVLHTLNGGRREEVREWPFNEANTDDVRFVFNHDTNLDARAAVALWDRHMLVELGGYDSRFDGVEDLHLAWKIDTMRLPFAFIPETKQSYYWCNPAQSAVEWRKQGQLRLYQLMKRHSTPDKFEKFDRLSAKYAASMAEVGLTVLDDLNRDNSGNPAISAVVGEAARGFFWRSRRMLKSTAHRLPLSFRVKEAVKTLLGRV